MRPARTARNLFYRAAPGLFWRPYARKARALGIDALYIVLSYDCDTDEDAEGATELFGWLKKRHIPATFAVPGAQLKAAAETYRGIQRAGGRFMNHGGAAHTQWIGGRYWSTTFYDRMSEAEVRADIQLGHRIFEEVLGQSPIGFRAPHFGHYASRQQLAVIYGMLQGLGGYHYSSTTPSPAAQQSGPASRVDGMVEFPVIGSYRWPLRFFDSYAYVADKAERRSSDAYGQALLETVDELIARGIPAVLNYYADPSHVTGNKAYYAALEGAKKLGAEFLDFEGLLGIVERKGGK